MLEDARVLLLVTNADPAETYRGKHHAVSMERALRQAEKYSDKEIDMNIGPECVAYILYTSGSTGLPKGVLVKRQGIINLLDSIQQSPGITAADRMLFTTTVSFDIAELEIFLPLVSGATMVIADQDTIKDGRALVEMARRENISIMQGAPLCGA